MLVGQLVLLHSGQSTQRVIGHLVGIPTNTHGSHSCYSDVQELLQNFDIQKLSPNGLNDVRKCNFLNLNETESSHIPEKEGFQKLNNIRRNHFNLSTNECSYNFT